jgi:hypothetical protein
MLAACLRTLFVFLAAYACLDAVDARACSGTAQDVFVVGNTTTDHDCSYSTIGAAVMNATCVNGTKIYLTDEVEYKSQAISISNQNISLIARAPGAKCGTLSVVCGPVFPCPTAPLQTIEGNIAIRGASNVTIQYLTITKGNGSSADHGGHTYGGAIDYVGTGDLNLITSDVETNYAEVGGGISYNGSGKLNLSNVFLFDNHAQNGDGGAIAFFGSGAAELHINGGTEISSNTTSLDGGGIWIGGAANLFMTQSNSIVYFNHADSGAGGGIAIIGPATAEISSPGKYNLAAIYENQAEDGGGIAVVANQQGGSLVDASLDLVNSDATHPVRISNNTATSKGGGIYLLPYMSATVDNDQSYAFMCARNFRIDNNLAPNGAAIYSNEENTVFGYEGGQVALGTATCGSGPAIACTLGADCNLIDANIASAGAVLLAQDNSDLTANHLVMRGNTGDHMVRLIGTRITGFSNTLIVDNHAYQAIISAEHDSNAPNNASVIDSSTIANNVVDGSYVIRNGIGLTLTNSIIDVADTATLDYSGNASYLHVSYVLADDTVGLPADPTIAIGAPTFIDAAHGDYRLRYSRAGGVTTKSLGLDFAPAIAGNDVDVRAAPHDQDLAGVADAFGPRDLGAIEMQNYADRIFVDSFGDPVLLAY